MKVPQYLQQVPLPSLSILHVSQGCLHAARGAAMYLVVLRKAIEVLAEYPDDVAVEHRLPRPLSSKRESMADRILHRHLTMFFLLT